jgi:hypothetical protein
MDAFRRPERFNDTVIAIAALHGKDNAAYLSQVFQVAAAVDTKPITQQLSGIAIKNAIHQARIKAIDDWLKSR